jgi:hypothetical protein
VDDIVDLDAVLEITGDGHSHGRHNHGLLGSILVSPSILFGSYIRTKWDCSRYRDTGTRSGTGPERDWEGLGLLVWDRADLCSPDEAGRSFPEVEVGDY